MATISFKFCKFHDCDGFDFTETTGRQPSQTAGYEALEDTSGYTGVLTFYNCSDELVATIPVTQSANIVVSTHAFADVGAAMSDGWYKVIYTVVDSSGIVIGTAQEYLLIDCKFQCSMLDLLNDFIKGSRKDQNKIGPIMDSARRYYENSIIAANVSNFTAACNMFKTAIAEANVC